MKLYYFDIYGRAEGIRMLLDCAKVEFEDVRMNKEQIEEMKAACKLEYGQVPMLELDDGTQLTQTGAIMRYLASTHGFGYTDPKDIYRSEHLNSLAMDDFFGKFLMPIFTAPDGEKNALA